MTNSAKWCQAGVMPSGTASVPAAKTSGAPHMVDRRAPRRRNKLRWARLQIATSLRERVRGEWNVDAHQTARHLSEVHPSERDQVLRDAAQVFESLPVGPLT